MYDVTVTCLKEVGVGKKVVKEFKGVEDYGWFDHCPVFFIVLAGGYHYFTQYEVQQVAVIEHKKDNVVKLKEEI